MQEFTKRAAVRFQPPEQVGYVAGPWGRPIVLKLGIYLQGGFVPAVGQWDLTAAVPLLVLTYGEAMLYRIGYNINI